MIVYYAVGGGLGHVTRARRVLRALDLHDAVVVASVDGDVNIPSELERDLDAHRAWIRQLGAARVIADAFPLGIRGELADAGVPLDYVARLLRWDEYRRAVPDRLPRFGTTYVVEPVTHSVPSDRIVELHLHCHPDAEPSGAAARPPHSGYWLVVHSGPREEVEELIAYARELQRLEGDRSPLAVATRCDVDMPPGCERVDRPDYLHASRIVSAAGFNVMLETEPYRHKHHVVPMPRRFDDQFARAARRRYDSSSRICAAR